MLLSKFFSRLSCSRFRYYHSSSSPSVIQTIGNSKPLPNSIFSFLPEIQNPCNLVRLVSSSLKQKDTSYLSSLQEQGLFDRFCSHDFSRILLRCQSDSSAAFLFFNWVRNHLAFRPSVQNCCIMIHILVWSKGFKQGMEILLLLIQLNEDSDISKRPDVFENLLSCTNSCNLEPAVFDMLIKAYLLKGMVKESFQTFRRMVKHGFVPSLVAINYLLSSLTKMNHSVKCWWVYEEMMRIGLHPDACTLNILINLLCKEGNVDKANKFLEEMEEEGYDFDIVTYNIIIDGYCKKGRLKDAVHLYDMMCIRGVRADVITYTTLVHGLCNGGSMKEAHQLFNLMVNRGLMPDAISYNTLIHGYCKEGMMQEARYVLFEMIGNRVHPDDFTCQMLIKGYEDVGRMISAVNLMLELSRLRVRISKDTYCYLIVGLCKDDRPFAAKSLLEKMQHYGYTPHEDIYHGMIESLCRGNYVKEALDLNAEMVSKGLKPNINTYRSIIGCLCAPASASERNTEEALLLMNEMVESGVRIDIEICRNLVRGLCKVNNLVKAESVLSLFSSSGEMEGQVECGYNEIVRAVFREGDSRESVGELMEFQARMRKLGFVPNSMTFRCVIEEMIRLRQSRDKNTGNIASGS